MESSLRNKYLVEFIGTFLFLYVILATGEALYIGVALIVAIMVGGPISGGMFNPAVSVMMAANGTLSMRDLPIYIASQVAGGLLALILHKNVNLKSFSLLKA